MAWDLSVDLIQATVQLEQSLGDGSRTVGTGFLIEDPTPDGRPRTILVTAAHVFDKMPSASAKIGYRIQSADGVWRYDPLTLKIRDGDHPLWVKHPTRDVAAIVVEAPAEFAKAAIPLAWLAQDDTFNKYGLGPGDEMMALGFPRGLSANPAGFPILRSGRVASYPLAPASVFPTFLMDFSVFPGNSGGPVFMAQGARRRPGSTESQEVQFVAGMLTQQVELSGERLEIGIVTHAKYIRETVALFDKLAGPPVVQAKPAKPVEPSTQAATQAAVAVSATAVAVAR
ncbi:peptidase S1 [Caulobacter sp. Root655]|uniref:trypsin-like serine peptidase n=1 Tax=Caulobacter sp. Root655 TaxID=1736578 RepID=UPI0006F8ADBD|nr:serine protease [Caulobacter sp. Root655]KRA59628.1 peptidase S1 [Caulobacter sp. Root655]